MRLRHKHRPNYEHIAQLERDLGLVVAAQEPSSEPAWTSMVPEPSPRAVATVAAPRPVAAKLPDWLTADHFNARTRKQQLMRQGLNEKDAADEAAYEQRNWRDHHPDDERRRA